MYSIYIESADEVTTVIERLRAATEKTVGLVAPKGATLLQSVVNLKLVRRAADDSGKEIIIISTDKIGRNLCAQLGIAAANTEEEAVKVLSGATAAAPTGEDAKVIAGVRIHHYYDEEDGEATSENEPAAEPIIIPKQMLKEEAAVPEPPIEVPASIPDPPAAAEVVVPATVAAAVAPVLESAKQAEAAPVEPLTRRTVTRNDTVETVNPSTGKNGKPKREKVPDGPITKTQKRIIKLSLFVGGAVVLALITIAFLFFPVTRVTLAVRASDWDKSLDFTATTDTVNPSSDGTTLPAEDIQGTSTKDLAFTATGSQDVGDKATGSVTFYSYSSTNTTTVPAGTSITASGKTFTTTAAATVPGYTVAGPGKPLVPGQGSATVTADASGADSNLSNASGSNVQAGGTVLSTSVTTSGGTSKTVTIVTADDISKAKDALTKQLTDDATKNITDKLNNRQVSFKADTDRVVLGSITSTVNVGDQVATGDVKGSITIDRTIVNNPTLDDALNNRLRSDEITSQSYQITNKAIEVTSVSPDGKQATLTVKVTGKQAPVVPVEDLARQLNGKSLAAGEVFLTNTVPTASVTVVQKPSWWPVKRYPTFNKFIVVEVHYE